MREEGAVGGSVAGSTAGWWPSDRDRFPPRFLLPPSLQTHNCIISTHLASSPLAPPPGPVAPPSAVLSLPLSRFVPSPRPSTLRFASLLVRSCARLLLSHLSFVRSSDRPTGRFSVPLFVSPPPVVIIIHHVSSALSHESVATRAKRPTASSFLRRSSRSRIVLPLALSSARSVSSPLSSLSLFLTSRSRGHAAYSLLHSSSSSLPPSPRRPPTAPTLLQRHRHRRRSPPRPPLLLLCISRSSFSDRTGNTSWWTQLFIPRDDVGSPRVGRTGPEDERTGGRTNAK